MPTTLAAAERSRPNEFHPEEMIWMRAYIMERERFDRADIAHILRCYIAELDWWHLVRRFGSVGACY